MTSWVAIRRLGSDEVERVGSVLGLARLGQGDGFYLVAWDGDDPLGHAHAALTDPPELQDVAVREEWRRRGVGRALVEAIEREVSARGHDRLRVEVSLHDPVAQALYRHCGYVETGLPPRRIEGEIAIRTGPIWVDDTLLMWEKHLHGGSG